jgi:hypothetical protein
MKADELKAELMKAMEGEIDSVVKAYEASGPLTLTQLEDLVLAARQRMGQHLVERMLAQQEQARAAAIPVSPVTGQRLHPKGQKKPPSRRGSGA